MSDRLRILLAIDNLDRGGAERVVVELAKGLSDRGHDVGVVAFREPTPLTAELDPAAVRVHRLRTGRWNPAAAVRGLRRVIAEQRTQVVHAHLLFSTLSVAMLPGSANPPRRVVTYHGLVYDAYPIDTLRRRGRRGLEAGLMRGRFDAHVAVDAAVSDHVARHIGIEPPPVIANGIGPAPVAWSPARSDGPPVIVCAASMKPEKDHATLIGAARTLADRGLDFRLRLLGAGARLDEVRAMVAVAGLDDRVEFVGSIAYDALLNEFAACDVGVLSSQHEGLPMVVLEALSVGAPFVATAVGGVPTLIDDGESGLLVPARTPDALADGLERMLGDRDLAARLGAAGRRSVTARFPVDATVDAYEAEYRRVLAEQGRRR